MMQSGTNIPTAEVSTRVTIVIKHRYRIYCLIVW